MSVIGQLSLTRTVTPRALDLKELKYNLLDVHIWCSTSVSVEVRVSSNIIKFARDLFKKWWIFLLLLLSPKEQTFHEVNLMASSRDFERKVFSSMGDFTCGR